MHDQQGARHLVQAIKQSGERIHSCLVVRERGLLTLFELGHSNIQHCSILTFIEAFLEELVSKGEFLDLPCLISLAVKGSIAVGHASVVNS